MEQYILYKYLKQLMLSFSDKFSITFNDMPLDKDMSAGIIIRGGEPSPYRNLTSGQYAETISRVQFIIQGGLDSDSLFEILKLSSKLKKALNSTFNKKQDVDGAILVIMSCSMLGDISNKGKTKQGRPVYSLNYKIKYDVGGI